MSKKTTSLSLAAASTFAASLAMSPLANAAENPFSLNPLSTGYSVADHHGDGEGKCGEGEKAEGEGKCGEGEKAEGEGKCGE
ncbi:MAG: low-complexity protein [Gammaproteobacteria bacterium]